MGTGSAAPDGAGSMRHGYAGPSRRTVRLVAWIAGSFMVLFGVGLALLVRPLLADEDGFRLPSGLALVQFAVGAAVMLAGVLLYVHSLRRIVDRHRSAGAPVALPCSVRRAVRRREAVPDEFRAHVPAWLDEIRGWSWTMAGQLVWMSGFFLAMNSVGGSAPRALLVSGGLAATYFLVFAVPLALFHRRLTRTRRHYAPA